MSQEASRELGSRFFREQDRLRGGPADELCAPDYSAHVGGNPPMDLAGHQQFSRMFYGAFPEMYHTLEHVVAEEDRVAVHFTLHGTHTGDFMGIPATGRTIAVPAVAVLHVADGRVRVLHGVFDQLGMLRQLGVIPAGGS